MAKLDGGEKVLCTNKTARRDYAIGDTYEAGIALVGTEVKALREGKADLKDSYARVEEEEIFLHDVNISAYTFGNRANHNPMRVRKLLLHKREIRKLYGKSREKGFTLIPLRLYFKRGKIKVELGVARGKKYVDRREDIKRREDQRDMERELRKRNRG